MFAYSSVVFSVKMRQRISTASWHHYKELYVWVLLTLWPRYLLQFWMDEHEWHRVLEVILRLLVMPLDSPIPIHLFGRWYKVILTCFLPYWDETEECLAFLSNKNKERTYSRRQYTYNGLLGWVECHPKSGNLCDGWAVSQSIAIVKLSWRGWSHQKSFRKIKCDLLQHRKKWSLRCLSSSFSPSPKRNLQIGALVS